MPLPRIDEHLELLTDMLGDALLVASPDGRVIGCNRALDFLSKPFTRVTLLSTVARILA